MNHINSKLFYPHPADTHIMSILILSVPAMCCPAEGGPIERALLAMDRVSHVSIDYGTRTVQVTHTLEDTSVITDALLKLGLPADVISSGSHRIVLSVPEMDCPVEAGEIQKAFAEDDILGADLNVMNRTVTLTGDDALEARAIAAIERCGYSARPVTATPKAIENAPIPWTLYIGALIMALLSEGIELFAEYRPDSLPIGHEIADMLTLGLALIAILMSGITTFKNGLIAVLHGNLNMNALMAVAVIGGVLIGAWPEAAMVMVLFQISEAIEQLSMTKARRSIRDLMSVTPETADVRNGNTFTAVPAAEVGIGAVVRVSPGDRVPLDGRIVRGHTALDQSMVTGESMPAEKGEGDTVWSGTVNLTSTIEIIVTAPASESLTARIIDAVENAQATKSPVQRFVDRFAQIYTPIVFAVALATAIIPSLMTGDWGTWIYRALCLLVIACPCALVISTPVTIVSALATATRCGLLIKGGLYLEQARHLKHVGLDKTGTLTRGEPAVAGVTYLMTFDEKLTGALATSLAAMNRHPLSQAIARWGQAQHLPTYSVDGFTALPGAGVEGRIEKGMVRLVNLRWLEAQGLADDDVRQAFETYTKQGMSTVALADTFGVQAVFGLEDVIKEDTVDGLRQLEAVGLTPWLLTGDHEAAAQSLAKKVGLTHVAADLLPDDKLAKIEGLQKDGLTAMVGDGINDAPALARSDIGIAMGIRGTDSAIEAAHVAVMDDKISSIATLVRLSHMTHDVLVQNIIFAIGVKVVFALLALSGLATMWMAVFADTGTCLIVVANAMRMLRAKPKLDRMAEEARV